MCLKGYFRGNKRLPHEFLRSIPRVHHPRGPTRLEPGPCPAEGTPRASATLSPPSGRRGRCDSHVGGARPPSCRAGEGEASQDRLPIALGGSAAARDREALRRAAARPHEGHASLGRVPADSKVSTPSREALAEQLGPTTANRD